MIAPKQCRLLIAGLALVAAAFPHRPVDAAAPWLIMVYGQPMSEPVVLQDWHENAAILAGEIVDVAPEELEGRPYLELALFWGPDWAEYVDSGKPLDALRPDQANQHGRFYPAMSGAAPLVFLDATSPAAPTARLVGPEAMTTLADHGIPVRLPTMPEHPTAPTLGPRPI